MRAKWVGTIGGIVMVAAAGWAQVGGKNPAPAPTIVMADQFEQVNDVAALRGHVIVLIYGDRTAADACRRLGEAVHVAFHPSAAGLPADQARQAPVRPVSGTAADTPGPDVKAIAVASIGNVPAPIRALIRREIRKASPHLPIWLDFEHRLKSHFGQKDDVPNIVIIDPVGRVRLATAGTFDATSVDRLTRFLDGLRREATTR